jgi:hypothetical protein
MGLPVIYKGIQYSVAPTSESDVWRWQFQIGETVMAARRVQAKIDAALRASATSSAD